jgi:hypothetical protein
MWIQLKIKISKPEKLLYNKWILFYFSLINKNETIGEKVSREKLLHFFVLKFFTTDTNTRDDYLFR